jgi:hypothetical protein
VSAPTTAAGRALLSDYRELAGAYHQVGSLRDHADPNDRTGWNLHGIETCEDPYCMDALAGDRAILAIEAEARAPLDAEIERLRAALERAIEAMDMVRDGLAVHSTDAIVISEESILRHAAREARAALEEPTP